MELSFRLLLIAGVCSLCTGYTTTNITVHGSFFGTSSSSTYHVSCTYPFSNVIKHLKITLETSVVFDVRTWGLDVFQQSPMYRVYITKGAVYPPRAVFHFHMNSVFPVEGTCSFTELDDIPTTTTTESYRPPFYLGFHPDGESHHHAGDTSTTVPVEENASCKSLHRTFPPRIDLGSPLIPPGPGPEVDESTTMSIYPPNGIIIPGSPGPAFGTGSPATSQSPPSIMFPPRRPGPSRPLPGGLLPPPDQPLVPSHKLPLPSGGIRIERQAPPENSLPEISFVNINYTKAIELSMYFYDAQRSGNVEVQPPISPIRWSRPSGLNHATDNGYDLTGGWYVGNDNVKMNFPMASAVTVLSWGFYEWKEEYRRLRLSDRLQQVLRWPLDYLMKTYDKDAGLIYTMVGNLTLEREMWYRSDDPIYSTLWEEGRWPVYSISRTNPGSDVAAEMAAAMAIASLGVDDESYGGRLLQTAKDLYDFAKRYPGTYSTSVPVGGQGYPDYRSSGYRDEMCLAAAMLFKVDMTRTYLDDAKGFFDDLPAPETFDWDDKRMGCALLLYQATREDVYQAFIQRFLVTWQQKPTTLFGLSYHDQEGPLRYSANAAFIALLANKYGVFDGDVILKEGLYGWATNQIDMMLGANAMRRSYQVMHGDTYVINPYHKSSACPHPASSCGWGMFSFNVNNTNLLPGALVGGPDSRGSHVDTRQNEVGNSVALDYNAGFQSALAGLSAYKNQLTEECNAVTWDADGTSPSPPPTGSSVVTTDAVTDEPTTYVAPPITAIPPRPTRFDFADALRKSVLFYDAQRSGTDPKDNRTPWRVWDKSANIRGAWFDDGSGVTTSKVMAAATTVLAWGALEFRDSYRSAGALQDLYRTLRWSLDYLKQLHEPEENVFTLKVGIEVFERSHWGPPSRREHSPAVTTLKNSYSRNIKLDCGQDVVAEVVTALAVGAKLFETVDTLYANELKGHAEQLYAFINGCHGVFNDADSMYYSNPSPDSSDEQCTAALWLFEVTGDTRYFSDGIRLVSAMADKPENYVLTWDNRHALCHVLAYKKSVVSMLQNRLLAGMEIWDGERRTIARTSDGLAWYDDGPLPYSANAAFLALLIEKTMSDKGDIGGSHLRQFAASQIRYMLGSNDRSFSYQIGYGERFPRRPHHRGSSCARPGACDWSKYNSPRTNPHELTGALVSGPCMTGYYEDVRSNYTMNRVSVIANAGFQSALAGLLHGDTPGVLPPPGPVKDDDIVQPAGTGVDSQSGSTMDQVGGAAGVSVSAPVTMAAMTVYLAATAFFLRNK